MENNKTCIGYAGTLTIEFPHNKIILHNNGTTEFFKLLNKFISRQTVHAAELPAYLMLYATNSRNLLENPNAKDISYTPLQILTAPQEINSNLVTSSSLTEVVVHTVTLSNSEVKSAIGIDKSSAMCFAILSADTSKILAATDIPDGAALLSAIKLGVNATVKWRMSFQNE